MALTEAAFRRASGIDRHARGLRKAASDMIEHDDGRRCLPLKDGTYVYNGPAGLGPAMTCGREHPDAVPSAEEQCLAEAEYWNRQRTIATERYAEAITACKQLRMSNATIARRVGKSETAIRMFIKRRIQT